MTDPIDDGTYDAYRILAIKILDRALRDAMAAASISQSWRLNAQLFLQSPSTIEFYRLLNLDLTWINRRLLGLNGKVN